MLQRTTGLASWTGGLASQGKGVAGLAAPSPPCGCSANRSALSFKNFASLWRAVFVRA